MVIVKKLQDPSRPDAVRLRRDEKSAMLRLMYVATVLDDLPKDIAERLEMIPDGKTRMVDAARLTDQLLNELRVTVPENQRMNIQHTAEDYEMRLAPRATPHETNVIMTRDEFKRLVDKARAQCRECILDDEECNGCELFQLLTEFLPMDSYHSIHLCPYNLGKWKN